MCDYSLEMYASRPARAGEKLVTTRFPSGSIGMTECDGDKSCAVCLTNETVLALTGLPEVLRTHHELKEVEAVTFIQLDAGIYRDGVRFENGVELCLQQLPPGVFAEVVQEPVIAAAPVALEEFV